MNHKAIALSERDALAFVLNVSNHFMINGNDAQISLHYSMQQSIYVLGLDVGIAEFRSTLPDRERGLPIKFVMLAAYLNTFLKYEDDRTLLINLQVLGDGLGLDTRDYNEAVRRWNLQKQYSFR